MFIHIASHHSFNNTLSTKAYLPVGFATRQTCYQLGFSAPSHILKPVFTQVVCVFAGLQNPFYTRLTSAVIDVSLTRGIKDVTRFLYGRVAMAYVQSFGLKAIAPFCIERF
jgi:hypothetical protein